jgi:excisionase family DNA binding protein
MKRETMETRENLPELFTASDLAKFCQVDLKTIHNWAEKGQIRHFRTPGRHLRFRRLDALDFMRKFGYPLPEALRAGKPKVLAVDQDLATLSAIRRVLLRRFEVTTYQDPFDALVALGVLLPDALVIEVEMAEFDGIKCIERLKGLESTSHIRVVVYSAQQQQRQAALQAGANDFIVKGEANLLREALERLTGLERS